MLEVRRLRKRFPLRRGLRASGRYVHAVDGLDLSIARGETVGLVGESGCGKSTAGRLVTRLIEPDDGQVLVHPRADVDDADAVDIAHLAGGRLRDVRRRVQMVFQDPYGSLNPRHTVLDAITEPLRIQRIGTSVSRERAAIALLGEVGLDPPAAFAHRLPHELSGGQRQRVGIARALVLEPELIVADEPTSMLDVSVRASILALLTRLAREHALAMLFITHDLALARHLCDRIAVMYLGKIVEVGPTERLLSAPRHPYTRALLSAVPAADPGAPRTPVEILGGVSSPVDPPPTCRFLARCPRADEVCRTRAHPALETVGPDHDAACYHPG
jgi:oligopeptide/dipeptide ABC transporter ATP-binding protein